MNSTLEPILNSPLLPEYIEELKAAFRAEQELRRKFADELTEDGKTEFINGEVVVHSPVKQKHSMVSDHLFTLISLFVARHRLGQVRHEKVLVRFPRNDYEPDIVWFGPEKEALIQPDTLFFPIPDLIVEVFSPSTAANDRGIKFEDYCKHAVSEYWIVDPDRETVELFRLQDKEYPPVAAISEGSVASGVLQGFTIPVRSIFHPADNLLAARAILT